MRNSKFPTFSQWKQVGKILKKSEKITLSILFVLVLGSFIYLVSDFYIKNTKAVPASGGFYTEGMVGQPRFINPIYGETNDIDRALINLVFSGLMTYDKDGKIVNDLVREYKVSEDGKTYDFTLKDDVFWHDGKPLTVDDIIFTIKTIQNSDYKSPLRANWIDVDVEKTSDASFKFQLKTPYNSFLENCTVKILPKHIWGNIPPESFALSSYNLQAIGSGPFIINDLQQADAGFIKSVALKSNHKYYNKYPFISTVYFQFFEKEDDLIKAANQKAIDGFSLTSSDNTELQAEKEIRQGWSKSEKFDIYSMSLPRYFAVFFNNQKSKLFSDENIRQALNYGINKKELINNVESLTKDRVSIVDSPIIPDFFNYQNPSFIYSFDQEKAKALLDKSGFKDNGSGQREKANDKKPAFQFKNYLALKSKGTDVTELQACLNRLLEGRLLEGETNGTYGEKTQNAVIEFQKKYLPAEEPTGTVGKKTRAKLNEPCISASENSQLLQFDLITINQPQLISAANFLKDSWQKIGVTVNIQAIGKQDLKIIIKERNYDALLYGQALGSEIDLYPFWHSSQKNDPGLNLSQYENKDVDALLKDARETLDEKEKEKDYEKLQNILIDQAPALFLYNPNYLYWVSEKVMGINTTKIVDPAKRFSNVTNWFIKTKRVWK